MFLVFVVDFLKIGKNTFLPKLPKKAKNSVLHQTIFQKLLIFRNPSHTQIVTFSLGRKGCDYFGECDYLACDYYEWGEYYNIIYLYLYLKLNINSRKRFIQKKPDLSI